MAKAKKVKEISFSMANKVGLLSEITTVLAKAKVNINALCAYGMEGNAFFMLTTSINAKAKKAQDHFSLAFSILCFCRAKSS